MFVPLTYRPGDLAEVDFFSVVGAKNVRAAAAETRRYLHLSSAAIETAIPLLDPKFKAGNFGDIVETG